MDDVESRLFEAIESEPGVTFVLGTVNTGKTTFVFRLAAFLSQRQPVVIIDSDIGQSSIGPPGCQGATVYKGSQGAPLSARWLHFIGQFSPRGAFLPLVNGLRRLREQALRAGVEQILIDTTGLVHGRGAWELKYHKIEMAMPRHLVCFQHRDELEGLIAPFARRKDLFVYRIRPSINVQERGPEERKRYRQDRLIHYFAGAKTFDLCIRKGMLLNPETWKRPDSAQVGRLVGLLTPQGDTLAMGVIRDIRKSQGIIRVKAPCSEIDQVFYLRFGKRAGSTLFLE